jgi:TRAP-type mannitol/chloroaromatic compound transport system permease large subunit
MAILLAFAPFFVYVVVARIFSVPAGLVTAAVTSLGLLAYDTLIRKKSAKILEIGTLPTRSRSS